MKIKPANCLLHYIFDACLVLYGLGDLSCLLVLMGSSTITAHAVIASEEAY